MSANLNYVNQLFIANVEAANTGTSLATIAVGDTLIVNDANTVLTGAGHTVISSNDNQIIRIAYGDTDANGNTIIKLSGPIDLRKKKLLSVNLASYSAPTTQVRIAGFNGTTGALPTPSNSTEYMLKVLIKDDQRYTGDRQTNQTYHYTTDASATSLELAFGFVPKIQNAVTVGNSNSYVLADVLTNGTFTLFGANAVVTQYSNRITSIAHTVVAGDYIRIGSSAATSPVYQVAEVIDANTFTIKGKYMGASATILAANIGVMTGITAVGIKITARTVDNTLFKYEWYQNISFEVGLGLAEDLGNTELAPFTQTVASFKGVGYWKSIRDQFYNNLSLEGRSYKKDGLDDSGFNPTAIATSAQTYNVVTITYLTSVFEGSQHPVDFPRTLTIAFNSATAPTASTKQTNFLTTLEALAESVGVFVQ